MNFIQKGIALLFLIATLQVYSQTYTDKDVNFAKFRFGFHHGWGLLSAKNPYEGSVSLTEHFSNLAAGKKIGFNLTYYFSKAYGAGLKHNKFYSKNRINNANIYQNKTVSNDLSINFLGPTFGVRGFAKNKKNYALMNVSIGKIFYYDKGDVYTSYIAKGNSLGIVMDGIFDIYISENIAFGIMASYTYGVIKEIEYEDIVIRETEQIKLEKDDYINPSQFSVEFGISIRL